MCFVQDSMYFLHIIYIHYASITLGMYTTAQMEEKV